MVPLLDYPPMPHPQTPIPTARPTYLYHLRPHVKGVQPVAEARVAVELRGPLAGSHAQLALPLLADVPDQLCLWEVQERKVGSFRARVHGSPEHDMGSSGKHGPCDKDRGLPGAPSAAIQTG